MWIDTLILVSVSFSAGFSVPTGTELEVTMPAAITSPPPGGSINIERCKIKQVSMRGNGKILVSCSDA